MESQHLSLEFNFLKFVSGYFCKINATKTTQCDIPDWNVSRSTKIEKQLSNFGCSINFTKVPGNKFQKVTFKIKMLRFNERKAKQLCRLQCDIVDDFYKSINL